MTWYKIEDGKAGVGKAPTLKMPQPKDSILLMFKKPAPPVTPKKSK